MSRKRLHRSAELPVLIVHHPDGRQENHSILGREVTIGRDRANRIRIRHHFISKFHAKIVVRNRNFTLVDLDSANRTRVNGRIVTESDIVFGDELHFAGIRCQLVLPSRLGDAPNDRNIHDGEDPEGAANPEVIADLEQMKSSSSADEPTLPVDSQAPADEGSSESVLPVALTESTLAGVPAFASWAGPLDEGENRTFRLVFFGAALAVAGLVYWTAKIVID